MKKKKIKVVKFVTHVSDQDCPQCGFPEIIKHKDSQTMKTLKMTCSKKCGWVLITK